MEIIITLVVLIIIWCVAFLIGAKQGTNKLINQIKKDGGYYDTEVTSSVYPICGPTSSVDEVPIEFLMGGNMEKTLHIAGVKEASLEKQKEWAAERRVQTEIKTTLSMEDLLNGLNKDDLQLKAGIKQHTHNEEAIKIASKLFSFEKDDNPLIEEKLKIEARRKEYQRELENKIKIDFEALNFSRISNEARKKITEIVKQDLEVKIKEIEKNTPEIKDESNEVKPKRKYAKSKKSAKNTKPTSH